MPKSVVTAAFPVIDVYLLNIFNTSIRESIFTSAWKKSLGPVLSKVLLFIVIQFSSLIIQVSSIISLLIQDT